MVRPPSHHEPAGRVAVYAAAGALVGVMPVPVVPRRILRAIRGAMAHDLCARHGLSLTREAREAWSEPTAIGYPPSMTRDALAYAAGRFIARIMPTTRMLLPVRNAYDTLSFGRLLARYLESYRPSSQRGRTLRIEGDEASAIRALLDRAALRVLRPGLATGTELTVSAPEDHRTTVQRTVDFALIGAASMPEAIEDRLDAALDEVMESHRRQGAFP
jgi:hypothetical protein